MQVKLEAGLRWHERFRKMHSAELTVYILGCSDLSRWSPVDLFCKLVYFDKSSCHEALVADQLIKVALSIFIFLVNNNYRTKRKKTEYNYIFRANPSLFPWAMVLVSEYISNITTFVLLSNFTHTHIYTYIYTHIYIFSSVQMFVF